MVTTPLTVPQAIDRVFGSFTTLTKTINSSKFGQETKMTVSGPPADVDSWSADYLRRYSPYGYDTEIKTASEVDGVKTVVMTRSHTCD